MDLRLERSSVLEPDWNLPNDDIVTIVGATPYRSMFRMADHAETRTKFPFGFLAIFGPVPFCHSTTILASTSTVVLYMYRHRGGTHTAGAAGPAVRTII